MDEKRYILDLHNQRHFDKQLGKIVVRNILYSFVVRLRPSAYDCHIDLNRRYKKYNRKIAYKNVYKRVQELYSHNLIRKVNPKENEKPLHDKVQYRLTSLGLFYMYYYDITNTNELLRNYSQNELYKIFLYPYIEQYTVESLTDESIHKEINKFLTKCCRMVDDVYLKSLKEIKETGGLSRKVGLISTLTDSLYTDDKNLGSNAFIKYLRDKFKIEWLNIESSRIQLIKKNRLIKVIEGEKELLLKIESRKLRANLFDDDTLLFTFDLEKYGMNDYVITEGRRSIDIENYITINEPTSKVLIHRYVNELCLKILELNARFHHGDMNKKNNILLTNKILKSDKSLIRAIDDFKSEIHYYYEELMDKKFKLNLK